jgi:hypothetical protein
VGKWRNARQSGRGFSGREVSFPRRNAEPRWFVCAGSWIEELDASATPSTSPAGATTCCSPSRTSPPSRSGRRRCGSTGLRALLAEQERIQSLREALAGAVFQLEGPFNMIAAAVKLLEVRGEAGGLVEGLREALRAGGEALDGLRAGIPSAAVEAVQAVNLNEVLRDVLRLATRAPAG